MKQLSAFLISFFLCLSAHGIARAQSLQVTYGAQGIQTLSYNGVKLEDLNQTPSDAFHIWHMKSTDLSGNVISSGDYGWGEANNGRSWDVTAQTWTYTFDWGTITVHFQTSGDTLNMVVTTVNNPNSGIIFDGATIYPFVLNFPALPANFGSTAYSQLSDDYSGPGVVLADYGTGEVVAEATTANLPLYSGFQPTGSGNSYTPIMSGTSPDGLATYVPHNDRPVMPGQTDTYTVALAFAPSGTSTTTVAATANAAWAAVYPPALNWTDRRIIGTAYLASSPTNNDTQAYTHNPRRYFEDPSIDVTTPTGLQAFQNRLLQQAASNVTNLQRLGAQGVITWDIEGEQYPQDTSYVCSPDQIAAVAPEMESVVSDTSSPYQGMKLDDAYFKIMSSAGFRIGVCIRPQQFTLNSDGTAQQVFLPDSAVAAQLIRKMKYAHDRWGVTLFYVDSTVDSIGGTLDARIFQHVQAALPDSLIIPEETTPLHYAYTSPFQSFIFHTSVGTPASVYGYYPKAFSSVLINDVNPATLAQYKTQLIQQIVQGDIMMVHADYWQDNNPVVVAMYATAAQSRTPAPTPAPRPIPIPTPAPAPPPPVVSLPTVRTPVPPPVIKPPIDIGRPPTVGPPH